jgi:cysteine desulfurase
MTVYLDCNATTPIEPSVAETIQKYMVEEFGNSGSRTHEFGSRAKKAVQKARDQIAAVVDCQRDEVIFTSGATESDNLAILGLQAFAEENKQRHVITTAIEHKAVLEPIQRLENQGFEVSWLKPNRSGQISAREVKEHLRPETILISVMHVNNETGVIQPISKIAEALENHQAFFHVDAAQGFGKVVEDLRNQRIDLISISGHKVYGPKGIGALIARRRKYKRIPLQPLMVGGGQELGLRPGTLPVALIVGLGLAAELSLKNYKLWGKRCLEIRQQALEAFAELDFQFHGDPNYTAPHVLNLSVPGVNAEAAMVALKDIVAISNGSACTSHSYTPSHVLEAMDLPEDQTMSALRFSWCHLTPDVPWYAVVAALKSLQ